MIKTNELLLLHNVQYEKLTDEGVEITFGVSLSKAAIKALTQDIVGLLILNCPLVAIASATAGLS
jgi:hypothetical protein